MMKLRAFLCKISPRYKLYQICKAIGIKPYPWQREFALYGRCSTPFPYGRCNGKTMAVMLRLLMANPGGLFEARSALVCDPDWRPGDSFRVSWYHREYARLCRVCSERGIPVIPLHRIYQLNDLGRRP